MSIIISDLDGTLFDDRERKKKFGIGQIEADGSKALIADETWKEYHKGSIEDSPIEVTEIMLKGFLNKGHEIIFWTGRNEDYRLSTQAWLQGRELNHLYLYMRGSSDKTSAPILKKMWLSSLLNAGFEVLAVLENDPRIVEVCKELGINCYLINGGTH